jgi:hypothetical protein
MLQQKQVFYSKKSRPNASPGHAYRYSLLEQQLGQELYIDNGHRLFHSTDRVLLVQGQEFEFLMYNPYWVHGVAQ